MLDAEAVWLFVWNNLDRIVCAVKFTELPRKQSSAPWILRHPYAYDEGMELLPRQSQAMFRLESSGSRLSFGGKTDKEWA